MADEKKPDEVAKPEAEVAKTPCWQHDLEVHGNIVQLAKENGGPVEHIICELTIKCKVCGLPYRFKVDRHMPTKFHPSIPTIRPDLQQLRLPIIPSNLPLVKEEIQRIKRSGLILPPNIRQRD